MDGGEVWSSVASHVTNNLYSASFNDGQNGFIVGSNGIILKTEDGGLSWRDVESPFTGHLFSVVAAGKFSAVAVGEQGLVAVTDDGGVTWKSQSGITGKVLLSIAYRGGRNVWVAGRGGTIIKRTEELSPAPFVTPALPPVLRSIVKPPSPRQPLITITDDGDIPPAVETKKDN